jgi:uncharacterized membrane protein YdjX (TVP38/TMEM64 family)
LAAFVGAVAVALMIPFLIAGSAVDHWFAQFEARDVGGGVVALVAIALLAVDVVAPVPSSVVAALAGVALGPVVGASVVFVGLGLGCIIGYGLGSASATRLRAVRSAGRALAAATAIHSRHAAIAVIVARPIPLLAEATVVVAGLTRMPRRRFAAACGLGNAIVAVLYAAVPGVLA